uniref:Uncharacterized protein n=1 Tax=Octopus bimaculoides TaxID=37653 RepID=A0A0L8GXY6_OCTBM
MNLIKSRIFVLAVTSERRGNYCNDSIVIFHSPAVQIEATDFTVMNLQRLFFSSCDGLSADRNVSSIYLKTPVLRHSQCV